MKGRSVGTRRDLPIVREDRLEIRDVDSLS